jgi:nicotinamidase-related amidase
VSDLSLTVDPARTALLLVDLQSFTVAAPTQPRPAADVVKTAAHVAAALRAAGGLVVHVVASLGPDGGRALTQPHADVTMPAVQLPAGWDVIPAELGPEPGDVIVTKWGWDGFHGTDLDLQLRRRGITTLLVTGIATNIGVESTARHGRECGYEQVFVADALSAFSAEAHAASLAGALAMIGQVRSADLVVAALGRPVAAGSAA